MFRPYEQNQAFLLPPLLSDFISESHPARMINDLVDRLDLTALENRYGPMGQPPYHPRMMVKVILYGFTVGIFSSRKLQRACQENLAFKYLAGMETPAFKTFIEFRRRHRKDMKAVFVQTVKLARELGLAKLGAVALDGCKLAADTSKHKAMSYGRMLEEEQKLKAEIERLLQQAEAADESEDAEHGADDDGYRLSDELARREQRLAKIEAARKALEEREHRDNPDKPIDPKKQISFADHDARCHSQKSDGTQYVYNGQAAVDMDSQVIVENHIEDSVTDAHAAEPALENMKRDLGVLPEKLVADAGYGNKDTIGACSEHEVVPVCATAREGKDGGASGLLDKFSYDRGQFVCPHGQVFEFDHENAKDGERVYRSQKVMSCGCCDHANRDGRGVIGASAGHLAKRELRRIMEQPGHRDIYRRRKCTVEPVFGQIQIGMGFRRFFYRGRENVGGEWNLVCAAFNVKKIAALIGKGRGWAAILAQMGLYVRSMVRLLAALMLHDAPLLQPA
jgi:transposase